MCDFPTSETKTELQPSGDVVEGFAAAAGGVRRVASQIDDCEEHHTGLKGDPITLPDAGSTDSTEQNMGLNGDPMTLPDAVSMGSTEQNMGLNGVPMTLPDATWYQRTVRNRTWG
ncbi:uncharacterized protein LOC142814397 [Rhipicephalus microplus]|uniref:uncharacterized protein LOC142814397 n=1 Tax=Rhipicephalus microplus TaxID=6941 RepID=UPI003F6A9F1D